MISCSLLLVANDLTLRVGACTGTVTAGWKNEGLGLEECIFWFAI